MCFYISASPRFRPRTPGRGDGSAAVPCSSRGLRRAAAGSRGRPSILLLQGHSCVYTILFSLLLMHILRRTSNTQPKTCLWKFFISKIFYLHWVSWDTEQPQHYKPVQLHSCSFPVHLLFKISALSPPTLQQQDPIIVTYGFLGNLVLFLLPCLQAVIILQKIK